MARVERICSIGGDLVEGVAGDQSGLIQGRHAEYCADIAVTEQELRNTHSKRPTLGAFVRFAELHLMDMASAWEITAPEQRLRVLNLLLESSSHYSPQSRFSNRSKPWLFQHFESETDEKGLLASPTGFEPVLSP